MLPWDIIDGGMKTSFFQSEFDKALREEWTLPPKRQKENLKLLPVHLSRSLDAPALARDAECSHALTRRSPRASS